jgi:hypothetical protein
MTPTTRLTCPVTVRLQNFTKKKYKEVLSHTSRNTGREPTNYVSPMLWSSLRLSFMLGGVLCSIVATIHCASCNSTDHVLCFPKLSLQPNGAPCATLRWWYPLGFYRQLTLQFPILLVKLGYCNLSLL